MTKSDIFNGLKNKPYRYIPNLVLLTYENNQCLSGVKGSIVKLLVFPGAEDTKFSFPTLNDFPIVDAFDNDRN